MKCMFCDAPATVHLTDIVNKQKREAHLCEACARERDLMPTAHGPQLDLTAIMNMLMTPFGKPVPAAAADPSCPECGLTYAVFKAQGRFGCAHDYEAFRIVLEPLLARVHSATEHAGKRPIAAWRTAELEDLRARMTAAAAAEDYEQAARFRDMIRLKEAEGNPG